MLVVMLAVVSALPAVSEPKFLHEIPSGNWIPTPLARGKNLLFLRYLPDGALLTDGEFVVPIEGKARWWGAGVLSETDAGFQAFDEHGNGVSIPEGTVGVADGALFIRDGCTLTRIDAAGAREAVNLNDCVEELRFFETSLAVRVTGGKTFLIRGTGSPIETGVELPSAEPRCGTRRCWVREPFKLSSVDLVTGKITFEELGLDPDVQSIYGDDEVFVSLSNQNALAFKRHEQPATGLFLPSLNFSSTWGWGLAPKRIGDGGLHLIAGVNDNYWLLLETEEVKLPSECGPFNRFFRWVGNTAWISCGTDVWAFAGGDFERFAPDAGQFTVLWPDGPWSWFSVRHFDGGPELFVTDGTEQKSVAHLFADEVYPSGAGVVLVKWSTPATLWQVPYERPKGCGCDGGASASLLSLVALLVRARRGGRRETRRPSRPS